VNQKIHQFEVLHVSAHTGVRSRRRNVEPNRAALNSELYPWCVISFSIQIFAARCSLRFRNELPPYMLRNPPRNPRRRSTCLSDFVLSPRTLAPKQTLNAFYSVSRPLRY